MVSSDISWGRRGFVCQGGSLRHGATFYGDINLDHNYDELEQELG